MTKIEKKIEGTEKRLQFMVMVGLFFPVLIEALFSFSGSTPQQVGEIVLKSGLIIFFVVLNYLLFEWQKSKLSSRQLDYLNWVFISTIICFVSIVLFFGLVANENIKEINWVAGYIYPFMFAGFMYIPVVSLLIMFVNFCIGCFKD